jgi:outer membrane protein OmpA-like peptidoglycan-associated protein
MRRYFILASLLLAGGCALFPPDGQRFVVFFQPGMYEIEDEARPVVQAAASYARAHADQPVVVAGFADPNGTPEGSDAVSLLRAQNVVKGLVANGVPAASIKQRSFGSVPYTFDSQEGRRVEITVGTP